MQTEYRTRRADRGNVPLRELARAAGYTPGEVSMYLFAEDGVRMRRWAQDLSRGVVPDELGHMRPGEALSLARREMYAFLERERSWMEFFTPKLKATEADVSVSGDVTLLELLKARGTDGDSGPGR
jgi:hypothetical protein